MEEKAIHYPSTTLKPSERTTWERKPEEIRIKRDVWSKADYTMLMARLSPLYNAHNIFEHLFLRLKHVSVFFDRNSWMRKIKLNCVRFFILWHMLYNIQDKKWCADYVSVVQMRIWNHSCHLTKFSPFRMTLLEHWISNTPMKVSLQNEMTFPKKDLLQEIISCQNSKFRLSK